MHYAQNNYLFTIIQEIKKISFRNSLEYIPFVKNPSDRKINIFDNNFLFTFNIKDKVYILKLCTSVLIYKFVE